LTPAVSAAVFAFMVRRLRRGPFPHEQLLADQGRDVDGRDCRAAQLFITLSSLVTVGFRV